MIAMKIKTKNKLRSAAGETLAETLVAVLIIAVALTMLAGMITATNSMIQRSKRTMNQYYTENVKLESFDGAAAGKNVKITLEDSSPYKPSLNVPDVSVQYAQNTVFSKYPVAAYRIPPT